MREDSLILRAASTAAQLHQGQTRKDGVTPYMNHVARVAGKVATLPYATPVMVAAAYLHDTIEDTGITEETLTSTFGELVSAFVVSLTNQYTSEKYPAISRAKRKELEHARLSRLVGPVLAIKIIDRMDNLRDIEYPLNSDDDVKWVRTYLAETESLFKLLTFPDNILGKEAEQVLEKAKLLFDIHAAIAEDCNRQFEKDQEDLIRSDSEKLTGVENV